VGQKASSSASVVDRVRRAAGGTDAAWYRGAHGKAEGKELQLEGTARRVGISRRGRCPYGAEGGGKGCRSERKSCAACRCIDHCDTLRPCYKCYCLSYVSRMFPACPLHIHINYLWMHLRYIRIHSGYKYPSGCSLRIHHDTSGYASDRKLTPNTIGNCETHPFACQVLCCIRARAALAAAVTPAVGERSLECEISER